MTNEEMIQDLKQFIEATMSQQMANVATKDDVERLSGRLDGFERRLDVLDEKLDTIQDAIADTLAHATEITDTTLKNHEQRLRQLEHRTA